MSEICTRAIGKPSLAAASVAVDADVGVHRERRGHEADLVDEFAELPREAVVDLGEAAEAREADDLEAGTVPIGRDLPDEALEVVLAAVEGPREAVEGDALHGRAELSHSAASGP